MIYKKKKTEPENLFSRKQTTKAEAFKQVFELLKHMTTLSSGSILLLVTFTEKVLKVSVPTKGLGLALLAFCFSILTSLATMVFLSIHRDEKVTEGEANFFAWTLTAAVTGFFIGICSLAYTAYPFLK